MTAAFWVLLSLLAVGALGAIHNFIVVRRCRFSLWLLANTCSGLVLLVLAAALLRLTVLTYLLAGVTFLFGAEGLTLFGRKARPAVLVPQAMHLGMILISFLMLHNTSAALLLTWLLGTGLGIPLRIVLTQLLRMRSDTRPLLADPVIGPVFARITGQSLQCAGSELWEILPHRPPAVMLDGLVASSPVSATATKTFRKGSYGLAGPRVLEPALIECLAQTVAALHGYQDRLLNRPPSPGMLVGLSDFVFPLPAASGTELDLHVEITNQLGPFTWAEGVARQSGKVVARGVLKFYVQESAHEAA